MKLYDENGYVSIRNILSLGLPVNLLVGGRATGKTFTGLKTSVEDGLKPFYMRRTQEQANLINKPEFSPFKSINAVCGWDISTKPITKYNSAFISHTENGEEIVGYTGALSTMANVRGFDASDVKLLIYDEFIPERHERPIKNEGAALLNAYETINRNRELDGKPPLQLLCLANANDPGNAVFMELGLVSKAVKMMETGQTVYIDRGRGIGLFMLSDSPISEKKKSTALYKLTYGSDFYDMSASNKFTGIDMSHVKPQPLKEFSPVCSIGGVCIYKHKSRRLYYVTEHHSGAPENFGTTEAEVLRFMRRYGSIWAEYVDGNIYFENFLCEKLLTLYLK